MYNLIRKEISLRDGRVIIVETGKTCKTGTWISSYPIKQYHVISNGCIGSRG